MTKEEAIYVLNNTAWLAPSDDTSVDKAIEIACKALSADVVEVVRCKDCKFFKREVCPLANIEEPQPNDYCSYGEREKS